MAEREEGEAGEQTPVADPALQALEARLAGLDAEVAAGVGAPEVTVPEGNILPALQALAWSGEGAYSYLSDLCGVDAPEHIAVVYHLFRPMTNDGVVLRVKLPRAHPRVTSVTSLWSTADWAEREAAEMYGITFVGHPDPRPLLLPEDIVGHPLRKDWEYPEQHRYLSRDPLHEQFPDVVGRVVADAPPPPPAPPAETAATETGQDSSA